MQKGARKCVQVWPQVALLSVAATYRSITWAVIVQKHRLHSQQFLSGLPQHSTILCDSLCYRVCGYCTSCLHHPTSDYRLPDYHNNKNKNSNTKTKTKATSSTTTPTATCFIGGWASRLCSQRAIYVRPGNRCTNDSTTCGGEIKALPTTTTTTATTTTTTTTTTILVDAERAGSGHSGRIATAIAPAAQSKRRRNIVNAQFGISSGFSYRNALPCRAMPLFRLKRCIIIPNRGEGTGRTRCHGHERRGEEHSSVVKDY